MFPSLTAALGDMLGRMRARVILVLSAIVALCPSIATSKPKYVQTGVPRALKEIEAELGKLTKKGAKEPAAKRYDAFMTFIGLAATCPAGDCHAIAGAQWLTANLDEDADDEKVLAITTTGDGACPSARMQVLVFDNKPKGWVASDQTHLRLSGANKPTLQVTTAHVHDAKIKDLVLRADGQCSSGKREHEVRIESFAQGHLDTLMTSTDHAKELLSHALVGSAPVAIDLTDATGKTRLFYDEDSAAYDPLRPYDEVLKKSVSKDDDVTLSVKECAAPLGGELASTCHVEGTAKLQIAVQHGKAVGATIAVTPANREITRCLRAHVATTTWKDVDGMSGCVRTFAVK